MRRHFARGPTQQVVKKVTSIVPMSFFDLHCDEVLGNGFIGRRLVPHKTEVKAAFVSVGGMKTKNNRMVTLRINRQGANRDEARSTLIGLGIRAMEELNGLIIRPGDIISAQIVGLGPDESVQDVMISFSSHQDAVPVEESSEKPVDQSARPAIEGPPQVQ